MLPQSSAFGSDMFSLSRQALLISNKAFDTSGQTSVEGFVISGTEPADTTRRFVFRVDGKLYKFSGQQLTEYFGSGEVYDILVGGNTAAELASVNNIPDWLGKKIYPLIALEAPIDAPVMPSAKISLKVRCSSDTYQKVVESATYTLAAADGAIPTIAEINADTSTIGNASIDVAVRLLGADGKWSEYMSLVDARNRDAVQVQFRFVYKVTTLTGSDIAKVNSISLKHTLGGTAVSGDVAELYSILQKYDNDIRTCRIVLNHKQLIDSQIKCYVNFMHAPKSRKFLQLGIASGVLEDFTLGVNGEKDLGVDQNTLQVYANGKPLPDFSYNVETSEITVNAPEGSAITASYDYGHDEEVWREMKLQVYQRPKSDGTFMSRYSYTLSDEDAVDMELSNIRVKFFRPNGHVENQSLGVATGAVQQLVLDHLADADTISCNADWSYDPDSKILTCVAPAGVNLYVSYDWLGESQTVYSFFVGWAEAISKGFVIPVEAWTFNPDEPTDFVYYADIPVKDLSSDDAATVNFTKESLEIALDASLCPTGETFDGIIRIYAEDVPAAPLRGQYVVFN